MQSFARSSRAENGCEGSEFAAELMTGDFYQYDEEHMATRWARQAVYRSACRCVSSCLPQSDTTGQIGIGPLTARFRFRKSWYRRDTDPPRQLCGTRGKGRGGKRRKGKKPPTRKRDEQYRIISAKHRSLNCAVLP